MMAQNSNIGWTDHTLNFWRGCTKVNAGCKNCYAEIDRSVKAHGVKWGPNGTRVRLSDAGWKKPHAWNKAAKAEGVRRRVFANSLGDVFEDWQGPIVDHNGRELCYPWGSYKGNRPVTMSNLRWEMFYEVIDQTPWLDWLLLTKRPENIERMTKVNHVGSTDYSGNTPALCQSIRYRHNVWLGTSCSDQETADHSVHQLVHAGARDLSPVLFVSAEPLIGPVKLHHEFDGSLTRNWFGEGGIDWVIVGGESGPNRRPCEVDWIVSIVGQCADAGVPCYVKQDSAARPGQQGRIPDDIWAVKEFPGVKL